jgi:phosphonate transport system substrate-binding protein
MTFDTLTLLPASLAVAAALSGCSEVKTEHLPPASRRQERSLLETRPVVHLGFLAPPGSLLAHRSYHTLRDHLTANTPYRFHLVFGKTSEEVIGHLEERISDVAQLGVVSYIEAHKQFGLIPLVKPLNREGEPFSRSIFLTRSDSSFGNLAELEGATLAFGPFHSTLGNLIPRYELTNAGLTVDKLREIQNLDYDEEVARLVSSGRFDAGAVKDVVAYQYEHQGLRFLHVSDPIPTAPLVVRHDMPEVVSQAIANAFLMLGFGESENRHGWNEEVRYGFVSAADTDYYPIRRLLSSAPPGCGGECHQDVSF